MEPQPSLPFSFDFIIGPYFESTYTPHPIYVRYILILSSHLLSCPISLKGNNFPKNVDLNFEPYSTGSSVCISY
jgi:hypothetical protein